MDDLISRQAAIDEIRTMQNYKLFAGDDMLLVDKAEAMTNLMMMPAAEPERMIYASMSDEEFEKWLFEHGICNPDMDEFIPCSAVPLLIDDALREHPSTQPELKWIPCSERLPESDLQLVVAMDGDLVPAVFLAFYDIPRERWEDANTYDTLENIIAWLPLPKPYKEESDG